MQQIGHYRILGEIARGGMGVVYRALDPKLQREVAIKLLLSHAQGDRSRRQRALREARALAKLSHPNIVSVHEAGETGGHTFLVMDLAEGETLQERIDRGEVSERQAATVVHKLADALSHAHSQGILHRDVKPDNVILTGIGEPKLTDFGLAKDIQASLTKLSETGAIMGTPGFWPPEQARGDLEAIEARSDVYSLGATLYAALTRQAPFHAGSLVEITIATLENDPERPSALRPGLDRGLEAICLMCLAKDPDERYESAEDLAWDLERYLHGQRPLALQRRPIPLGLLVGLGVTAALVLGLAAGLALGKRGSPPEPEPEVALVEDEPAPESEPPLELPPPSEPEPDAISEPKDPPPSEIPAAPDSPVLEAFESADPLPAEDTVSDADRQAALKRARQGMQFTTLRAWKPAAQCFEAALAVDPSCALAHTGLAILANRNNEPDAALASLKTALEHDPKLIVALYEMGYTLGEKKRRYAEAIDYLDRAIALRPNYGEAYRRRGEAKRGAGDKEGAVADFELAIKNLGFHPKQRVKVQRSLEELRASMR